MSPTSDNPSPQNGPLCSFFLRAWCTSSTETFSTMKIYPTYSRELSNGAPLSSYGNRSRANTSDSSSGASEGSDGHPSRRRSHRPRGCRGGRKNRRSQQAKAVALLPKEIVDPLPLSPRANNAQDGQKVSCLTVMSNRYTIENYGMSRSRSPADVAAPAWKPPTAMLEPKIWGQDGSKPSTDVSAMTFMHPNNIANHTSSLYATQQQRRQTHFRPLQIDTRESPELSSHQGNSNNNILPPMPAHSKPTRSFQNNPYALQKHSQPWYPRQKPRPPVAATDSFFAISPRSFLLGHSRKGW